VESLSTVASSEWNPHLTARAWLRTNGYVGVVALIDEVMAEWAEAGRHTRRDWWEILAGGVDGAPRTVGGRIFPVLRAARERHGLPPCPTAIALCDDEVAPPVRVCNRWPRRRRRRK